MITLDQHLLDITHAALAERPETRDMFRLAEASEHTRLALGVEEWRAHVASQCAAHPVNEVIGRDPYTGRAKAKPRGYAGDAVMLDYIYFGLGNASAAAAIDPGGRAVFDFSVGCGAAEAVRLRRNRIAREVEECAARKPGCRILALASGHLREAAISPALRRGDIAEWVALDQDAESLATVASEHAGTPAVRTTHASVRSFLRGEVDLGQFDLVYAAGLFDYLDDRAAAALIERAFASLLPAGRLYVANFRTGTPERGFMEAFADWWLIYRTEEDMRRLSRGLAGRTSSLTTATDATGRIVELVVERARAAALAV